MIWLCSVVQLFLQLVDFGLNFRVYPPGGFVSLIQQPHYPQQPQVQGENFHLVGQPTSFNPISQSPPSAYGTPQHVNSTKEPIVVDEDDNNGANRPVQKRYWSHEEKERLVISFLIFHFVHSFLFCVCRPVFGTILDLFIFSYCGFCRPVLG
jgi:hypothetical protein